MPLHLGAIRSLKATIMDATEQAANDLILAKAVELTPKDTGELAASGRVTRDGNQVWVSFGRDDDGNGAHAPSNTYAVRVHEDMEMAHPHGGQAKFLENAADEAVSGFAAAVAQRVKK